MHGCFAQAELLRLELVCVRLLQIPLSVPTLTLRQSSCVGSQDPSFLCSRIAAVALALSAYTL